MAIDPHMSNAFLAHGLIKATENGFVPYFPPTVLRPQPGIQYLFMRKEPEEHRVLVYADDFLAQSHHIPREQAQGADLSRRPALLNLDTVEERMRFLNTEGFSPIAPAHVLTTRTSYIPRQRLSTRAVWYTRK